MKANEINDFLDKFLNNKCPYNCILINGAWGIGKTYEIDEYFKRKKTKKIINITLFGMKNLESLYSELSFQSFGIKSIGTRRVELSISG